MSKTFNKDLAARVLVDALFTTDVKAAAKYGITDKTIRNYRDRLQEDEEFYRLFLAKKEDFDRAWAEELPGALRRGLRLLGECTEAVGSDARMMKSPQVIEAVATAVKVCAEIELTSRVINARLAEQDRPGGKEAGGDAPSAEK